MRKKLLLIALFAPFGLLATKAQTQIVNGDMELWDNVGANTEEPQQWNSFMTANCTLGGFICGIAQNKQVQRSTEVRPGSTGTYSARIWSRDAGLAIANGNLTTGKINMGSSTANNPSNFNFTDRSNAAFRTALTARPDSIVFWAKYQPNNNSTTLTARMKAAIHDDYNYRDPEDAAASSHVVGSAELNYTRTHDGTNYVWKRFSVPFNYSGPATTPAYILITFTSCSTPGGGAGNDQVWIDDVELKYVPVTTTVTTVSPVSYNVTATAGAAISIPFTKTGNFNVGNVFTAQLSDASGSFASPVTLGTLTSSSAGTINGTIPAGTASGTGYRVRVIASSPYQTANPNTDDISINLVSSSIAPTAAQTIAAGTNGTALTVTESTAADSRVWKFATAPGGPYSNITPAATGTSYTPNFANAGTYYVVCESTIGGLALVSNEVTVNVVKNQIAPAGTQSILVSVAGTPLTVTETPAGTDREWLVSNTAGGPYTSFGTPETGNTYTPLFNTAGTYYVVCRSTISGVTVTSNEVVISVGTVNLTTGTIAGSPFEFSASAPDATISVPYTTSNTFAAGNTFTAQLSDASGSFASPTAIGSVSATTDGTISATIPAATAAGTGYLIRVVASNPVVLGSDNGTALTVDQFHNDVTPAAAQTFVYTATGTQLSVAESQTSSREWRIATVAGGPYTAITPAQTGSTYIPSVSAPGTYYIVCASTNQYDDEVLSNEVRINAENGNTLATSAITGSPFYVSPSAANNFNVTFTSNVVYNAGNVFTAQLSNASGSFVAPVTLGSITAQTPGTIAATLPNVIQDGTGYRIRVVSSSPAIEGTDNGANLSVINFAVQVTPADSQAVQTGEAINALTLQSTHPGASVEWTYRTSILSPYSAFTPLATGTQFNRSFADENTYMVRASAVNSWGDTLHTQDVVIEVNDQSNAGITENEAGIVNVFRGNDQWMLDISHSTFQSPQIRLTNMSGQTVYTQTLQGKTIHTLSLSLASGVYTYHISENGKSAIGKIIVY